MGNHVEVEAKVDIDDFVNAVSLHELADCLKSNDTHLDMMELIIDQTDPKELADFFTTPQLLRILADKLEAEAKKRTA